MASPHYCDNPLPHKSHEWDLTGTYGDHGFTFCHTYRCWGVIEDSELRMAEAARDELLDRLDQVNAELAEASIPHRRTERQFYEGDDAPKEYDDAEG